MNTQDKINKLKNFTPLEPVFHQLLLNGKESIMISANFEVYVGEEMIENIQELSTTAEPLQLSIVNQGNVFVNRPSPVIEDTLFQLFSFVKFAKNCCFNEETVTPLFLMENYLTPSSALVKDIVDAISSGFFSAYFDSVENVSKTLVNVIPFILVQPKENVSGTKLFNRETECDFSFSVGMSFTETRLDGSEAVKSIGWAKIEPIVNNYLKTIGREQP